MDLSKYRLLKTSKNGKIKYFKYSDIARIEEKEYLIYHYPYDYLNEFDKKKAIVVLFSGKTGDGKTTAINAFFNIIKGVKLDDDFRFILIDESSNNRGQDQSQTDGIHFYYLKDKAKRPLILIDSQGFADIRGIKYDDLLDKSFEYAFSNKLDHINAVCFIVKSTDQRLNPLSRYVIGKVTGLFAEDIDNNFFFLTTFANSQTMEDGPQILDAYKNDNFFSQMISKMKQKYFYSFDSLEVFNKNKVVEDSLSLFSYNQLIEFYHKALLKSFPINTKKTAEVLVNKNKIRVKANQLKNTFQDLSKEQKNLKSKKETIQKKINEIEILNQKIENTNLTIQNTSPEERKRILNDLLSMIDLKIEELNNQTTEQTDIILEPSSKKDIYYTYCNKCLKNCHDPCDCWLSRTFDRCKVFTVPWSLGLFGENVCEKCGCVKSKHVVASQNHYVSETKTVKLDNSEKINNYKNKKNLAIQGSVDSEQQTNNLYNTAKDNLATFENRKKVLEKEKENFEKNKIEIEKKMEQIKKKILLTVLELQKTSSILERNAFNKAYIKNENDYIDELSQHLSEIGDSQTEQINKLNEIKNLNKQFMKYSKINIRDLEVMSMDDLVKQVDDFFNNN